MKKGFIATVLAVALAVTGASTIQARADSDDVVGALIGLAIIAGIASAIDDDDDHNRVDRRHRDQFRHSQYSQQYRYRDDVRERPRRLRRHAKVLPRRCQRVYETRRGERVGFARGCLNRRVSSLSLPRRCLREAETNRGWQRFYGKRCLLRHGYRVAGRRH